MDAPPLALKKANPVRSSLSVIYGATSYGLSSDSPCVVQLNDLVLIGNHQQVAVD